MTTDDAQLIAHLSDFIEHSPTPYHVADRVRQLLVDHGFVELRGIDSWPTEPGRYVLVRDGSVVAWIIGPSHAAQTGFRLIGAHTDSPNLRLKPQPDTARAGFRQLGVEVYGGVLLNSWLDRDLGVAGRVVLADGTTVLVRDDEIGLRVPQLAIHLDREISDKGLLLNRQTHMAPIWALGEPDGTGFVDHLLAGAGVDPEAVRGFDLMAHPLEAPRRLGLHGELLAAPRIDNQLSCFVAARALVDHDGDSPFIPVVALFDHEEVGSTSATGAGSPVLRHVLERIVVQCQGGADDLHRASARSIMCSADGAHATHPNYLDRHEPDHHVRLDGGPVLKHNANARYATDAVSEAAFVTACEVAGVPVQHFVNRADLACGSTIGPISAAELGISTVDAGCAQLSMHSARELCGTRDPGWFLDALRAFLG